MTHEEYREAVKRNASLYRAQPHRFVKDFLHIEPKDFQALDIIAMNEFPISGTIGSRGIGKTFELAIFGCVRAVLWPGSQIVIASGKRSQSINILEKIRDEILPKSPELRREIDGGVKIGSDEAIIRFKNTSFIKVVTAADSARGNRANVLILDEFRMIDKEIVDAVLTKFLTVNRQPGYLSNPKYEHLALSERNRQIYKSSAFFQDHWSYTKVRSFCKNMVHPERGWFMTAYPYQMAIREKLVSRADIEALMLDEDFNEIRWSMEMLSEFYGNSDGSFFDYGVVAKNRKIQYPMLPKKLCAKLKDDSLIRVRPKERGEVRIISVDVALMASGKFKNDATSIIVNRCTPSKTGRYVSNVIYAETLEGVRTDEQALKIRRLYEEFSGDYIVLDCLGGGAGIYDALSGDMPDTETGDIYPALSCCNNTKFAQRCVNPNAPKVIWAITGNARFNSECATMLREGFKNGKIRLLVSEYDGEKLLSQVKGFDDLRTSDRAILTLPYVEATLLINELINLEYESGNGLIRVHEKSGMRKDRYSSLAYNYYVACCLERDLRKKERRDESDDFSFSFRAPKVYGRGRQGSRRR